MLHADRVIKGWPDAWRPQEIYGQFLGSNNLINQRLVGEIEMDDFEVSHTKDYVLWLGDQESLLGAALSRQLADLIAAAKTRRPRRDSTSSQKIAAAVQTLQLQLSRNIMRSNWLAAPAPSAGDIFSATEPLIRNSRSQVPDFAATLDHLSVSGYLTTDVSVDASFIAVDSRSEDELSIVVNMNHPYVRGMTEAALLEHLRQCALAALAEWKARHRAQTTDPDTIHALKDSLLRLIADGGNNNGHDPA
jgi:hypothetical protein